MIKLIIMILVKVVRMAMMMIVVMIAMMAVMMVTTMMTMMMSRGNEWVTMASCGIIMGGSALAYTTATIIRFEEEVEVFFTSICFCLLNKSSF